MECSPVELIERRFAIQHLTTAPLPDPVDVVKLLLCVQAQDAPLARYSIGLRVKQGDDALVRSALDQGRLLRTHILRPTWHFVAAEDLRWILALTSGKVESSLAGRHRQLGVDSQLVERAHSELLVMLEGRQFKTAADVGERFASVILPLPSVTVRHLLLLAELRGLVCSGPLRGSVHTYGLADELVAPTPALDRDDAARQLVQRFFVGHGPASEKDLRRWTTLTLAEIRTAVAELGDVLETVRCDGTTFWTNPAPLDSMAPSERVALLPTFDEAYLPYRTDNVARVAGHPRGEEPHSFAEAGGGVVIADFHDAGWWKRTDRGDGTMHVRLGLATGLSAKRRRMITDEAAGLAAFFERDVTVEMVDP